METELRMLVKLWKLRGTMLLRNNLQLSSLPHSIKAMERNALERKVLVACILDLELIIQGQAGV